MKHFGKVGLAGSSLTVGTTVKRVGHQPACRGTHWRGSTHCQGAYRGGRPLHPDAPRRGCRPTVVDIPVGDRRRGNRRSSRLAEIDPTRRCRI